MKKQVLKATVALAFLAATQMASASTVVLSPSTPSVQSFSWTGLGPVDTDWSMTVAGPSYLTTAVAWDAFIPGDKFEFTLDGVVQAWDSTTIVGGYFQGQLTNLFLSAGTHLFGLNTIALAPGYESGSAYAFFGGVTPAAVPVPAAALLFGSALLGAVGFGRRKETLLAA